MDTLILALRAKMYRKLLTLSTLESRHHLSKDVPTISKPTYMTN
jgi:hypothetical protein